VVFDLDDTLIDTAGVLLPDALRRVAAATGLALSDLDASGKRIDEVLRTAGPLTDEQRAAAAAAWYSPSLPDLAPLPGARAMLGALEGRTLLFLLTRGDPARQQAKIDRCGLAPFFDETIIRPIEQPGSKADDLRGILSRYALAPERLAVVGDDPRDELKHAAALGCPVFPVPQTPLADLPRLLAAAGLIA